MTAVVDLPTPPLPDATAMIRSIPGTFCGPVPDAGIGLIGVGSDDAGTGESNPALAEGGVIFHHAGVAGGNDLVAIHDWDGPVASVTVERVD